MPGLNSVTDRTPLADFCLAAEPAQRKLAWRRLWWHWPEHQCRAARQRWRLLLRSPPDHDRHGRRHEAPARLRISNSSLRDHKAGWGPSPAGFCVGIAGLPAKCCGDRPGSEGVGRCPSEATNFPGISRAWGPLRARQKARSCLRRSAASFIRWDALPPAVILAGRARA